MRRILPILVLAGCAGGGPSAPEAPGPARSVPGFDVRDHPGTAAMATWRDASPYRWVGYYLTAPCYTGTSWRGKRAELRRQGWGLAVLFVGEQDWSRVGGAAMAREPEDTAAAGAAEPRCTASNLSAERGSRDAAAAVEAARAEGFPPGTWIYLDVERVESVSPELSAYVRAWAGGLLAEGTYLPGLYAHDRNAPTLVALVADALARRGRTETPRLWVAGARDFGLDARPAESGHPAAWIWQGPLDVRETWDGVTLRIDPNVAVSPDPSGG